VDLDGGANSSRERTPPSRSGTRFRTFEHHVSLHSGAGKGSDANNSDRLWDPTPIEISQLEEALGRELSSRLRSVRTSTDARIQLRDYFRQYAGIHRKRQRLIFVNGFHRAHVVEVTEWLALPHTESQLTAFPADVRGREFWRKVPVQVTDGGAFFFEALYDPQIRRIVSLQFNGVG
jgi:hypothetical protein